MDGKTILQRFRACGNKPSLSRQTQYLDVRLQLMNSRAIILRTLRTSLSLCVALWMAGAGCLWGCSNTAYAASSSHPSHEEETQTVEAGSSCHKPKHDCCAKESETSASQSVKSSVDLNFAALPSGMMKDCPLAVSATAVTSKNSNDVQSVERVSTKVLGAYTVESRRVSPNLVPQHFLNRGPTYLRCCVFLI